MWLEGSFKISRMSKNLVIKKVISEIHKKCPQAVIHVNSYTISPCVFDSEKDAVESFNRYVTKNNISIVCDFYCKVPKPNPNLKKLEENYQKAVEDFNKYNSKYDLKFYHINFKTCLDCNSTINLSFVKDNNCPVCGKDLRKEVVVNKVKELNDIVISKKKVLDDAINNAEQMKVRFCYYKVYIEDNSFDVYI